jgi:hypothetical protein
MFFHYCDVQTFIEIMKSKVLWLSNLTESNDTEEVNRSFISLWNIVKKRLLDSDLDKYVVEEEIEILDQQYQIEVQLYKPFGICFCNDCDVLLQWLEYGDKTRGVVLGFDLSWFTELKQQMPHPSSNFLQSIGYHKVLYHDQLLEDGFYNICYDAIKEYGLNAWIMAIRGTFKHYSAFIKNPTFRGEYETRIVYYPYEDKNTVDNELRVSALVKKPFSHYLLPWTDENEGAALKAIGLGCNCELTQNDVHSILTSSGLNNSFTLFKSECSYRIR